MDSISNDFQKVLDGDFCVGCGACAYVYGTSMDLNEHGFFRPHESVSSGDTVKQDKVCPMSFPSWDENFLAEHFIGATQFSDEKLGKYDRVFAAHVSEGQYRSSGSSGGIGSWLPAELLSKNAIDGVVHVKPLPRKGAESEFFSYQISSTVEEVLQGSHSHYHVSEISNVMNIVKSRPGRYLFIGVPCMVKAVRRLQLVDKVIEERVKFSMALVCGHLKSVHWALSLGWGAGVKPDNLDAITFRVKQKDQPAKAYFFGAQSADKKNVIITDSNNVVGGKFNQGAMMPNACNYCDDVVGETADITIGDAWLPRYQFDPSGKNMVVVRNQFIADLLDTAHKERRISIDTMSAEEAHYAQDGGFRQRREGLAFRLKKRRDLGKWAPEKRLLSDMTIPGFIRGKIYELRQRISAESAPAFRKALDTDDFGKYEASLKPLLRLLRLLEVSSSLYRILLIRVKAFLRIERL